MTAEVVARRWPRRAAYVSVAGLAVLLPTGTAGASWFLADQVLNVDAARQYPVRVRGVSGDRVTLSRTPDTARSMPLSFVWPLGHAQLGPVTAIDRATVVREVTEVTRGSLQTGIRGYSSSYVYEGDPRSARGIDYQDVSVPSALGPMPAWFLPGPSDVWVIAVHGRAAPRGEALRILPALADHPTLVITYRNDEGAPAGPDRLFHLGDTEWQDTLAAIRYAKASGARGVILYGWSMGGGIALMTLRRWAHEGFVRGLILDCPVIDWTATLQHSARGLNIPSAWTWTALRMIERRLRLRLPSLDHRPYASRLDVPTLMIVDHDDATVAPAPSMEFASSRSDLVTLYETHGAGHCRSWNLDPAGYESAVKSFLSFVDA
jgi:pimeloyl-ACP methyl ester carboxylesterase